MSGVGIRDLKDNLSAYVRRVRQGEIIEVTHHGQVVAELRPPRPARSARSDERPGDVLRGLERAGLVRVGLPDDDPAVYDLPPMEPPVAPGTAQELLDAVRGER